MNEINLLIDRLRSVDKDTRLKACKELRHASRLSKEARDALELVMIDSDPAVARAAHAVLRHHMMKKIFTRISLWIGGILGAGFILFMLYLMGLTSSLTCERIRIGGAVDCIEHVYLYSLIPLYEREFQDVRSAEINVSTDSDGEESYTVELTTSTETDELEASPSVIYRSKQAVADEINDFINNDTEGMVVIDDRGILTFGDAFICIGLPLAFLLVYELIKGLAILAKKIRPVRNLSVSSYEFHDGLVASGTLKRSKPLDKGVGERLNTYGVRGKNDNSQKMET